MANWWNRLKLVLIGKPLSLDNEKLFESVTLAAFLAWVGLGADGLSSSSYGPAEAFKALGSHTYLALLLAVAAAGTVFIISLCYSRLIKDFPHGGGGYVVASKLLGKQVGVVAGSALLVDYVLTVTTSVAAAGDVLFSLLPHAVSGNWKLWTEVGAVVLLTVLNLRGVKESIVFLLPIFIIFLVTKVIVLGGGILLNLDHLHAQITTMEASLSADLASPEMGLVGLTLLFLRAYSLGGGTYTGIEAVSNSMALMREPRVATGQRTMTYMSISLAIMVAGLIVCYLLLGMTFTDHPTMNVVLTQSVAAAMGMKGWFASTFVGVNVFAEGLLLFVAAQAGFIAGPRVLANMANDLWMPKWLGSLSERLATQNGVLFMAATTLAALVYTRGDVSTLVVMYSINVFVTFSLSLGGMCRLWWRRRRREKDWWKTYSLFLAGFLLCSSILVVTTIEKFADGGWVTLVVTTILTLICFGINRHYKAVAKSVQSLDAHMHLPPERPGHTVPEPDPTKPTGVVLVGGYGGLGVQTTMTAVGLFPKYFSNLVFISVAVVETGNFKGADAVEELRVHTERSLEKYRSLANRLDLASRAYMSIGTDVVDELENLCLQVRRDYPNSVFFAGQLIFQRDTFIQRLLHNETAVALLRRLQWAGVPMVILPTRVGGDWSKGREGGGPRSRAPQRL